MSVGNTESEVEETIVLEFDAKIRHRGVVICVQMTELEQPAFFEE